MVSLYCQGPQKRHSLKALGKEAAEKSASEERRETLGLSLDFGGGGRILLKKEVVEPRWLLEMECLEDLEYDGRVFVWSAALRVCVGGCNGE